MWLLTVATEATPLNSRGGFTESSADSRTHVSRENSVCLMDFLVKAPLVQLVSAGSSGRERQQQCSVRKSAEGPYPM